MKSISRILTLCAFLGAAASSRADVTVAVDSTKNWLGYMNVYELNGTTPVFDQPWATADLKAAFSGGSLTLKACAINDSAGFWYNPSPGGPGGIGNKSMEATMYVDSGGIYSGQTVTFSGTVQANTWVSPYNSVAFIADFAPDYSSRVITTVPLAAGAFSVSLATNPAAGRHIQYGFKTFGPNVWSTDVDSKGLMQIQDVPPPFVPDQIPNGDFEIPGGASWGTVQGTPTFPASGGNPGGYATVDGTAGFTVLYAFSNTEKTFASLGLAPGDAYKIQLDMRITNGGSNIGGIRLEGPAGYAPEFYPTKIGDGSTWATYTIDLTVPGINDPPTPKQTKIGLRPGAGSIVAFDNVSIILPIPAAPPQPTIIIGKTVNWTPTVVNNFYQPQESNDGSIYTPLGPAYIGTAVSSLFDATPAPFYRVQESVPVLEDVAYNGGFEIEFLGDLVGWTFFGQVPTRITTEAHTGTSSVKILATGMVGMGAVSGLEQNTTNATNDNNPGGTLVTAGKSYDLSFWAKNNTFGPGYLQRYIINWLNAIGAIVPGGGTNLTFPDTGVAWQQIVKTGLVAPAGAVSAQILIQGEAGAFPESTGEVIIDDVTLVTVGAGAPSNIAATSASTAEISWQSVAGQSYQLRSSTDLSGWSPFGGVISGNNSIKKVYDTPLLTKKFYQLGTLP